MATGPAAPGRGRPPGGGGARGRLAHGRHGLRGAQQPRPLRHPGRHRPERQRPLLRPHRLAPVERAHPSAPEPLVRPRPRADAHGPAVDPGPGRAGVLEPARAHQRRARDRHPAPVLRGARRPLRRTHRRPRHRQHGAGLVQRGGVGRPHRGARAHPQGLRLCARRRGRHPAPARLQGAAVGGAALVVDRARHLHRRLHPRPPRLRPPAPRGHGHHRGDARPHGPAPLPGRVPRPLPRRGHRRAARRHRRRRHGHGRPPARGGGVFDVLQPRLRPGQPRRRPAPPARGVRPRPGRHHRRRRAQPPRRARPVAHALDPGHDGVRTILAPKRWA